MGGGEGGGGQLWVGKYDPVGNGVAAHRCVVDLDVELGPQPTAIREVERQRLADAFDVERRITWNGWQR